MVCWLFKCQKPAVNPGLSLSARYMVRVSECSPASKAVQGANGELALVAQKLSGYWDPEIEWPP